MRKAQHTMAIKQMENYDFVLKDANETVEKSQTNATNVTMPRRMQVIWGNI